ncbi:putative ATPase [Thermoplasmatales archaeon BRNA1]|nr:putative ATPase [Thermoplasmatales archaeon BRNA1]
MFEDGKLWIAQSGDKKVFLYPRMANRHGLITGASGTGKTVTLRVLAESFSSAGIPVFFADMKGDVGTIVQPGDPAKMADRAKKFGFEYVPSGFPARFWDVYGDLGTPVRATMSSMGAQLLSRLMGLSEVQADVLNVVFSIARDRKWEIIDTRDLRAVLQYVNDHKDEFTDEYGTMSTQSIGAVQRNLRSMEESGGDVFFGEPAIEIKDWMKCDDEGRGYINVLNAEKLSHNPALYATFMMWLMSELFDKLPEAGDVEKPKLVFFFDEAHMLFSDAPKALVQKIEQMVKLIRSKGVGIYFVSQSPSDIPDTVLAQLSNRIQHALRAYTPAEQKAVKAAATAFRANPAFKTQDVITELGVGEALVSCLDEKGAPSMVERAFILPPQSRLGALDRAGYERAISSSPYEEKYRVREDRESAYEKISALNAKDKKAEEKPKKEAVKKEPAKKTKSTGQKQAERAAGNALSSFARSAGTFAAKSLFGKKK